VSDGVAVVVVGIAARPDVVVILRHGLPDGYHTGTCPARLATHLASDWMGRARTAV
jgi:hypothetical protein